MSDQECEDLLQGFRRGEPNYEAIQDLQSSLIGGYERAVHSGLAPTIALGAILDWAAEECQRIGFD
jgi:hypothetical protein